MATDITSTKIGTEAIRSTSHRWSMSSAAVDAWGGNQSMASEIAMPTAVATRLTSAIPSMGRLRNTRTALPRPDHGAGLYFSRPTCATRSVLGQARLAPPNKCRGSLGREGLAPDAAEARRRCAVVAPEGLGELGGLAVAHGARHLVDRRAALAEQLGRPLHAHTLEIGAEAGLARLRKGALQLAARGDHASRDVVELHAAGVLLIEDAGGVVKERATADGGGGTLGFLEHLSLAYGQGVKTDSSNFVIASGDRRAAHSRRPTCRFAKG